MDLRQMRSFVRVVELGSMSRAALDLDLVQSALSQQISRLESELSARLLQRTSRGVTPTDAGVAFYRQAQLALRHVDEAMRAAREARVSGSVSIGLAPTTAAVLGLPLMQAMRERHPDVRLHLVEAMSGHLSHMLNTRQLDLAVLFDIDDAAARRTRWAVQPLLDEQLYLIESGRTPGVRPPGAKAAGARPAGRAPRQAAPVRLAQLAHVPLILPMDQHGLRTTVDAAFAAARIEPNVVAEIDSLAMLMDAVQAGLGATVQPWAAMARHADAQSRFRWVPIADERMRRRNCLCSLGNDELSPAALAARVVLNDCVRDLVQDRRWQGTQAVTPA